MSALGIEVLFGSLTVTGSFIAFGKLAEFIPGRPITYMGQNLVNAALFFTTIGFLVFVIIQPDARVAFFVLVALSAAIGLFLVLPIGGADMPVVISLLNSYAGLAASATGFAIDNTVLIIAGALDGASGFLLSIIMSRAMNRSFRNILFGAFGAKVTKSTKTASGLAVQEVSVADAALRLAYARLAVIVPGYGMAVAQAQHQVKEVVELIERNGGEVRFAIHPVAGRMPGHMNVLLAEANIPYESLVEMADINPQFPETDVALIVGANDVVNPAAVNDPRESDLRDADHRRIQGAIGDRPQALDEPGLRWHRERAVLHAEHHDALRRRQGIAHKARRGDEGPLVRHQAPGTRRQPEKHWRPGWRTGRERPIANCQSPIAERPERGAPLPHLRKPQIYAAVSGSGQREVITLRRV